MAKMSIPTSDRPQVKAECLRLLTTLKLEGARMQLISGFVDTYLKLDAVEEQAFKAAVDTMGLDEREEVMEIVTSWEQRAIERVAVNLLRYGMAIEAIALLYGVISYLAPGNLNVNSLTKCQVSQAFNVL